MSKIFIAGISLSYLALLFGIAYLVERQKRKGNQIKGTSWIYALSLAVYCTGWTYYGSVGRAVTSGLEFLTIYLGPSIMCALFVPVLQKILRICKTQRINSIADFISTRYGKDFSLGVVVTLCCIVGIIPYIALQLKAISTSFHVITGMEASVAVSFFRDDALFIATIIAIFIIVFGTRSVDASERHEGLIAAIAFESIIKLVAFIAVGVFVTWFLYDGFASLSNEARTKGLYQFFTLNGSHVFSNWATMILVSMLSIVMLPRQFQVSVVENTDERHLQRAVWMFPLYLFVINIFVLPIAMAGTMLLSSSVQPDTYVLSLPIFYHKDALGILVYIGGLSAASSMIIVETIALATMVSNHLFLPMVLSASTFGGKNEKFTQRWVLYSRRLGILFILLLAYLYDHYLTSSASLVSIGLISMAAVAQFTPAVLGGIYWKHATKVAALSSIVAGFSVWFYTLIVPSAVHAGIMSDAIMKFGPWGISWLKPQALFGLTEFDLLAHSFFWSMIVNIGCYVSISMFSRASAQELYQGDLFVNIYRVGGVAEERSVWKRKAQFADVKNLLANFIGKERSVKLLQSYAQRHKIDTSQAEADPRIITFSERILSGVIGSASARFMVSNVAKEEDIRLTEVLSIVRESQQVLELNKELKKKSAELSKATHLLTHANEQLKQMDVLKDEFLYTVTHELRTPLTSIRAMAEILFDTPDMDEDQRQVYLEGIVKEVERLSYLITQVLNLERYESGRQKLHFSSVDISFLVKEVIQSLKPLASEKGVAIEYITPSTMILVQCDSDMIRQVVYNLVSNAIKFSPDTTGLIQIASRIEYDELQVWVADNGRGIPDELHQLIFDKFFQARNQTLQKPTGSGLGLAICKKIVELHQGAIHVENVLPQGAKFVFTLPYS